MRLRPRGVPCIRSGAWGSFRILALHIDFTPNPDRRHSRGHRGHDCLGVVENDQVDFLLSQADSDWHSRKHGNKARSAARLAQSNKKAFSLRGHHGGDFHDLKGEEREAAMRRCAMRARVKSGTQGISHAQRKWMESEGLLAGARRPRKKNAKDKPKVVVLSLLSIVARFKRTGDLPPQSASVIEGLDKNGVDGKALRRMIAALLIRGGIEPDPGPDSWKGKLPAARQSEVDGLFGDGKCVNDGNMIVGEKVTIRGRVRHICTECRAELVGFDKIKCAGFHPKADLSEYSQEDFRSARQAFIDKSHLRIVRPPTQSAPDSPSTSRPVILPQQQTFVAPPAPKPVPAEHKEPEYPPPAPKSVPKPPVPSVEKKEPEYPDHPLNGHNISEEDCVQIMSRLVGKDIEYSEIAIEEIIVPYAGERRLATSRNVQEIKKGFHARQMSVYQTPPTSYREAFVATISALATIGGAASFFFRMNVLYGLCAAVIVSAVLTWHFSTFKDPHVRTFSVPFVPHLVSSVMAEYDRGTNATAARSTLRQKMRRLASLPIPDEDALKFIAGSELICEQLLTHEDFFWEGAACFRQPQ